jgi:hypothetical protein
MKKLIFLVLIFISLSTQAQFKFGAIGGVGVSTDSKKIPLDSFVCVGQIGPLVEYAGQGFSIRSGGVFQIPMNSYDSTSNKVGLSIPLQAIFRSSRRGGFVGLGASFEVLGLKNNKGDKTYGSYDLIFGNKVARNIDFSVCFSYPMRGGLEDACLSIRMCIFPLSTCQEACGF